MKEEKPPPPAVVLGATGPTGFHLAAALRRRGKTTRVVSRSREKMQRIFGATGEDIVAASALDADQLAKAVDGASVVFDCIGLPPDQMDAHAKTARSLVKAAAAAGARIVHVSSFWAYLPLQQSPLNEDHPRQDGNDWVRHRREAEDILQSAGAAVLNLPDFYGPEVRTSSLQQALQEATDGKTVNWLGSLDTPREYVYVPDAMEMAAEIAERDEAFGQRWILPGGGPLSGDSFRRIVSGALGHDVKMRSAGLWMLRLVSLFSPDLRGFMKMVPDYLKPIAYDASKLEKLLGDLTVTPYDQTLPATLLWLEEERRTPAAA